MKKQLLSIAFGAMLLALCVPAQAQQPGKIFRVGYLDPGTVSGNAANLETFRQELSKLGWIEGRNRVFEYRLAENKAGRLPELAAELVRLEVDLIVTSGTPPALAAQKATSTIPIVMMNSDPVALGLVASLAQPGSNVTGLSSFGTELGTKRLEILKDVVPKLARVGLLKLSRSNPGEALQLKELRVAASALKVKLEEIKIQFDAQGLDSAFKNAKQKQVKAIMTTALPSFSPNESGSLSLPPNTACRLFTHGRNMSMREVSCPMGSTRPT